MKRPDMSVENYEEFYKYFSEHDPDPRLARAIHHIAGFLFQVHTTYEEGAESAIDKHFARNGRVLMVAHHSRGTDPVVLASLAEREKVFKPLIANTVIQGHIGLNQHPLTRGIVPRYRKAIPVIRGKDLYKIDLKPKDLQGLSRAEIDGAVAKREALKETIRAGSKKAVIDITTQAANKGWNVAIFPSGSRKNDRVRRGVGEIACGIEETDAFRIVPVGIAYNGTKTGLSPSVHVGNPHHLPGSPEEVTELVQTLLDNCQEQAEVM